MESTDKKRAVGNMAGLHPFSVFPEELWPFIGQKLGDSVEIQKLIQTIPEIEGALHAKKRYWLFDQVIPLVSKFLKNEDKLSCRQVCTQWSRAVDNFLESHPSIRAYDHGSQIITGQLWTDNEGQPTELYERNSPPLSHFHSQEKIANFLKKMGTPPGRWRNPFMNRWILINSTLDMEVLTGMRKILEPFGHHIWGLGIVDVQHRESEPYCNSLREWLGHLPNLKVLMIQTSPLPGNVQIVEAPNEAEEIDNPNQAEDDVDNPNQELPNQNEPEQIPIEPDDAYLERWRDPLPPLPHLEALIIKSDLIPTPVINALVTSYSQHIRAVELPTDKWKPEFHSAFPHLTELVVPIISPNFDLRSLLLSIQTPFLHKLELQIVEHCCILLGTDIFPWRQRFPLLRSLIFHGDPVVIREGNDDLFSPTASSIPSVKYLRVGIQYLYANSDFLLCFPNVEYIHLEFAPRVFGTLLEPSLKIWEHIFQGRMYESNVWELLPKLKGICLTPNGNDEVERRFKRETYDYRRKQQLLQNA